jgi:hypothetical protein
MSLALSSEMGLTEDVTSQILYGKRVLFIQKTKHGERKREEGGKLSERCLLLRLAASGMGKQSEQAIFSMTSSHAYALHMLSICIHQSITRDKSITSCRDDFYEYQDYHCDEIPYSYVNANG